MKKKTISLFTAFLLLTITILTGCNSSSDDTFMNDFLSKKEYGTNSDSIFFKGNVLYENKPVYNSNIYFKDNSGNVKLEKQTDETGAFYIYNDEVGKTISPDRYMVEIESYGFNKDNDSIDLEFEDERDFYLELKEGFETGEYSSVVAGKIIDSYTLNAVENVSIEYGNISFLSNIEGEFAFGKDSEEIVTFTKENYKSVVANFNNENVFTNKIIYLDPILAKIRGVIVDSTNMELLKDVIVTIYKNDEIISSTTTDSSGIYKFSNISCGEYLIKCEHNDYETYEFQVNITDNKEYSMEVIELSGKTSSIYGKIMDVNTGIGIANVAILAGDGNQCFTDAEGNYNISSLTSGFYELNIVAPGFEIQRKNIYLSPNTSKEEDFQIKQEYCNGTINLSFFTVYDGDILPLNYTQVNVILYKYFTEIGGDEDDTDVDEETDTAEVEGVEGVTDTAEVSVSSEYFPVNITLEQDESSTYKVNMTNLFSGYYKIEVYAVVSSDNSEARRPAGSYSFEKDMIFISPGLSLNMQIPMIYDSGLSADTTSDTEETETETGG
ncbi:MAG: hypothetical protein C0601_11320 [Candidatus Muiribacterium halophilum]|uniref:Carboxypeptidase regulatory-like domain-containing protein n=1 Tax=Muiribacterium halophilum TaxID=2053465 RepID=A0A2N5ZC01_MUIH1|nr:MAG: hypothetical protein C0601_11320 [Candidatus Muirbacterium halophilum]